jgi:hypothetical protein
MISKVSSAAWLVFAIGALVSLLSAPFFYVSRDDASLVPPFIAAGGFVGLLLLMSLFGLWVKGSQTNPSVLAGVFIGLLIAGTGAWLLVPAAIGGVGLLVTGIIVEISRAKTKSYPALWVKGFQTHPSVLAGVFIGLLIAGTGIWLLVDNPLGIVSISIGGLGLLRAAVVVEVSRAKAKSHH